MRTQESQSSLRIRYMEPGDRAFILSLASRLEAVGIPPWRDPHMMRAFHRHYAEATVNASASHEAVFIAEAAGDRLGVVHVMESSSGLTGERQGYVATLAVTEASAGQGVGRALMEAAEAWCRERGLTVIALDVFAQNSGARAFYEHLGYLEETLTMIRVLS